MRCLLDTHVLLWWLNQDKRLKSDEITQIQDAELVCLSVVSAWEIAIKVSQKKLRFKQEWYQRFKSDDFELLGISIKHAQRLSKLQRIHSDPFDRMLIAQALEEGLVLVTGDEKIWEYEVPVIKC